MSMLADQIRFVTGHFYQLQGLRLIPVAMFLLWYRASERGWLDWLPGRPVERPGDLGILWGPATLTLAIVGVAVIESRYTERYGSVLQHPRQKRLLWLGIVAVAFLLLMPIDRLLEWPVLLSPLIIALALAIVVRIDRPFRFHYVLPAVVWGVVGVSPLLGFNREHLDVAFSLAGAVALIVCGVGDHFLIVRTMSSPGKRLSVAKPAAV
jgi:hypothetical protein